MNNNRTKITIGIGTGFRKSGAPIDADSFAVMEDAAIKYLLDMCGGYTWHRVAGGWRDETGKDIVEPGLSITVTVDLSRCGFAPERIAAHLRDIFDQQCVLLETHPVNSQLI